MSNAWRLLDTGTKDPYTNMSIDEALSQLIGDNDAPILRFFDWNSPCISIGYSQKIHEVLNVKSCNEDNIVFVRRPTGGGVVFHGGNITYSAVLPRGIVKDIYAGYDLVQENIRHGLKSLNNDVNLYRNIEKADLFGCCFTRPNYGDIMVGGKKLGGLAARRVKQRILYQGYLFAFNMYDVGKYIKSKMDLDSGSVSVASMGRSINDVKNSIVANWNGELRQSSITDEEEQLAVTLSEGKYSLEEWNCKR